MGCQCSLVELSFNAVVTIAQMEVELMVNDYCTLENSVHLGCSFSVLRKIKINGFPHRQCKSKLCQARVHCHESSLFLFLKHCRNTCSDER